MFAYLLVLSDYFAVYISLLVLLCIFDFLVFCVLLVVLCS